MELFYNFAVTRSFFVTPDVQILEPGLSRNDTAILFALRAKLDI